MKLALFFSRESPYFPRLGKHHVSKQFWFLILFSEKKNEIPEVAYENIRFSALFYECLAGYSRGCFFRGENNMFVFQNQMGRQMEKNVCEQFFKCANDNRQEQVTVQTVVDAVIHA